MSGAPPPGRTLLLAEHPFRDLLSQALLTALRADLVRGAEDAPLLVHPTIGELPAGFEAVAPGVDPRTLGVTQVILAGVFLERRALEAALSMAAKALTVGAKFTVRNFGVEGDAALRAAPEGGRVLDRAERIDLRDHQTANVLTQWRLLVPLEINPYPERHVAAESTLATLLPARPVLGLAIRSGAEMRASWQPRLPALKRLLARAAGWPILPLPVQGPGDPGDDMAGTKAFAEAVFDATTLLMPRLSDHAWWRRELTAPRLKGLVARCALLVTNRDLVAAYAVAAGVPVIGIALGTDRRIISCLAALANELPEGSDLTHPMLS